LVLCAESKAGDRLLGTLGLAHPASDRGADRPRADDRQAVAVAAQVTSGIAEWRMGCPPPSIEIIGEIATWPILPILQTMFEGRGGDGGCNRNQFPACRRRTVQELRPTGLIQNGRARPLVATETKATAPRAMISPAAPINLIIGELATWPNEAQKPER
jgi:hypothetical protein